MITGPVFPDILFIWLTGCCTIIGTWVAGYPLVSMLKAGGQGLTRHIIGFLTGICLLSISGVISEILSIEPLILQGFIFILGIGVGIFLLHREHLTVTSHDNLFFIPPAIFCVILWSFFFCIGSWMGGDAVAHASIIRLLIDHQILPISLPPVGTYWEYYPKGFHLYAYPFARIFGVIPIIQTLPVTIAAFIPVTIACILITLNRRDAAWFALIGGLMCVPQIWATLIWGGYTSLTAGLLLTGIILSWLVDKRFIPLFSVGILFAHSRELAPVLTALVVFFVFEKYDLIYSKNVRYTLISGLLALGILFAWLATPSIIDALSYVRLDPSGAIMQVIRWYWVFPAICGISILLSSHNQSGKILFRWLIGLIIFLLVVLASGQMNIFPPERILTDIAIPLVAFLGIAMAAMTSESENARPKMYLTGAMIIIGTVVVCGIFGYYSYTWALPPEDKAALNWISEQNYTHTLAINLDETGGWIYPVSGVPVSHPRVVPGIEIKAPIYTPPWNSSILQNTDEVRRRVGGYDRILLYISSVSIQKPGYSSPFSEYPYPYPNGTFSLPPEYVRIYNQGTQVYELRSG